MSISVPLKVKLWKDRNGIWMVYSKKFDISGYGKTRARAMEMFQSEIEEILLHSKATISKQYEKNNYL